MVALSREIIKFFEKQGHVIVATLDSKGGIHIAAKGIVGLEEEGKVFLLDMYTGETFRNLKDNPKVSVTAIDEHAFLGYNLKGTAKIVNKDQFEEHIVKSWQDRIVKRVADRILKNVTGGKRPTGHHPEAKLPQPKHLIEVDVEEVIDLTPKALKG